MGASSTTPKVPPPDATITRSIHLKLRAHLNQIADQTKTSKGLNHDVAELLMTGGDIGLMEAEDEMEKTWKVDQDQIVRSVGIDAAAQRREWKLDGGPYRSRYTRNGRHLAIAGKHGHVAAFDWRVGTLHMELQLRETLRDITFLQDQSHIAVAQRRHVFIYDQSGVELHRLSSHVDVNRLEYLPYHWLLVSIGNAGYLKYTDTSTGTLVTEQRTKLGACNTIAQNIHNAVIYLGHQNGTVTLRTPNLPTPAVTLLAHLGPVTSISVDPSSGSGGRYMATGGADGKVKVWDCRNWKGCVREWVPRSQGGVGIELEWSQKGILGVSSGGGVNCTPPTIRNEHSGQPPVYMTHAIPHRPLTSLRFCPFTDVLTIAGEPNFDSSEADPFENSKARREREVRALLDKIQPDLIALTDNFVGKLAPQKSALPEEVMTEGVPMYSRLSRVDRLKASRKADEDAEVEGGVEVEVEVEVEGKAPLTSAGGEKKEKLKQRGKGKSLKRYLRKKRKNVIDPSIIAIRAKIAAQKQSRKEATTDRAPSALDRFSKSR
ncbi:hypothetical protein BS47DRAFT_1335263 [Hydnum rufescens UP504]|uniref:U three protein 7 n=1 Tax=Hydnum rufescens UP504 TaxID=1448309 RepID=A0A9P6BB98_9AGAM|nr:hypothetical protein BS47DRAFT_1335263 [Hydnum rufescens UP504]